MIRHTLLTLALLAGPPALVAAQQPSPIQGKAAVDTTKAVHRSKLRMAHAKRATSKGHKPAAKPAAKDTATTKP